MVHFDTPYSLIYYQQPLHCAVHTWRGYFLAADYQQAMQSCLEVIDRTGARALIIDVQKARSEDGWQPDWTRTQWFPLLLQTDIRKMAVVVAPLDFPPEVSRTVLMQVGDHYMIGRFFDNLEEATRWVAVI